MQKLAKQIKEAQGLPDETDQMNEVTLAIDDEQAFADSKNNDTGPPQKEKQEEEEDTGKKKAPPSGKKDSGHGGRGRRGGRGSSRCGGSHDLILLP